MKPSTSRAVLTTGGAFNLVLGLLHLTFPGLLDWQHELAALSSLNRAIFYTAHWAMVLVLFVFAYVSIAHWRELVTTRLGRAIAVAMGLFWLLRTGAELALFRVGVDGTWWRAALFAAMAVGYFAVAVTARDGDGQSATGQR